MMEKKMNTTKLHMMFLFTVFFAVKTQALWTSCYDKKTNKLHFISYSEAATTKKESPNKCFSSTFYKGPKEHHMIQEIMDPTSGFATGEPGAEMVMKLDKGRQLMISQWNNLSKINKIIVLEPNFKTKQVKKLCQIPNFGEAFSAKVDKKSGQLKVKVLGPRNEKTKQNPWLWKTCKIK